MAGTANGAPRLPEGSSLGRTTSICPQILEMLRAARERGIPLVMLNTNGIRLARDPGFAPALASRTTSTT